MLAFEADTLAAWTGGRWSGRPVGPLVGFSVDSRRLTAGQIFVALRTGARDGHAFLGAALAAGASAAFVSAVDPSVSLAQLVVPDPLSALQAVARGSRNAFRGAVIAVTGSAGKTSTKELLSLLLGGEAGGALATEGNLNNHIGVALTLCRLDAARHSIAIIEAGISAPGEMRILAGMIDPDMVLVTLVGPAHLEDLGDLESVAREKAVLAAAVREGGLCIFPSAALAYAAFRSLPSSSSLVLEPLDVASRRAVGDGRAGFSVEHSGPRTKVAVAFGASSTVVTLPRVTDGMAANTALAICAALKLGIRGDEMQRRLSAWRPSPLRGEWTKTEGRLLYLDCYNANPASMADALSSFYATTPIDEPRLLVIGCMEELGAGARRYHQELGGALVLRPGDKLIAIGTLADAIRQGALEAGLAADQIVICDTVGPMADQISAFRGSVFVKGSRRHALEKAFAGAPCAEATHA